MIIPPSSLAVLLGSLAKIDVGRLLIAGVGPGLVLAVLYSTLIFLQVKIDPDAAPQYDVQRVSLKVKLRLIITHILPMSLVIFMVIGLILLGIATPSEAAAFGVLGVLILALSRPPGKNIRYPGQAPWLWWGNRRRARIGIIFFL